MQEEYEEDLMGETDSNKNVDARQFEWASLWRFNVLSINTGSLVGKVEFGFVDSIKK